MSWVGHKCPSRKQTRYAASSTLSCKSQGRRVGPSILVDTRPPFWGEKGKREVQDAPAAQHGGPMTPGAREQRSDRDPLTRAARRVSAHALDQIPATQEGTVTHGHACCWSRTSPYHPGG